MQEILFSFRNNENKRIKELRFKYNYSLADSYIMQYNRNNIVLSLNYFEDLVSLYKKTTRSSLLDELFKQIKVNKNIDTLNDKLINIKINKNVYLYPRINFLSKIQNIELFTSAFFIDLSFDNYVWYLKDEQTKEDKTNNIKLFAYYFISKPNNQISETKNIVFLNHRYFLNIYKNISFLSDDSQTIYYLKNLFFKRDASHHGKYINANHLLSKKYKITDNNNYILTYKKHHNVNYQYKNDLLYKTNQYVIYNMSFLVKPNTDNNKTLYLQWIEYFANKNIRKIYSKETFTELLSNKKQYFISNIIFANKYNQDIQSVINDASVQKFGSYIYLNNIDFASNNRKPTFIPALVFAYKNKTSIKYYENINAYKIGAGQIGLYNQLLTKKSSKPIYVLLKDYFANKQKKSIKTLNNYFCSNTNKSLYSNFSNVLLFKNEKNINSNNINVFVQSFNKNVNTTNNAMYLYKNRKSVFTITENNLAIKQGFILRYLENAFASKQHNKLYANIQTINAKLYYKPLYNKFENNTLYKSNFTFNYVGENSLMHKLNHNLKYYDQNTYVVRQSYKLHVNQIKTIHKQPLYLFKFDSYTDVHKSTYLLNRDKTFFEIFKEKYNLHRLNTFSDIYKEKYDLNDVKSYLNGEFIIRAPYSIKLLKDFTAIYKENKLIRLKSMDTDYIIKTIMPIALITEAKDYLTTINKINYHAFTKEIITDVYKKINKTAIYRQEDAFSKIPYHVFFNDSLVCDKIAYNVKTLELFNYSIIKSQIQSYYYNTDMFITKNNRSLIVYNQRISYNIIKFVDYINEPFFVSDRCKEAFQILIQPIKEKEKEAHENNTYTAFQSPLIQVMYNSNENWLNSMKYAFFTNQTSLSEHIKELQYEYKESLLHRNPNGLMNTDTKNIQHFELIKNMTVGDILRTMEKDSLPTNTFEHYFINKDILLQEYPELQELHRNIVEANLMTNPVDNWVWVYTEDEPFDDPFKIDELLLPENDTRYENLEEILFDRDKLKPRDPIRIIDDYTFIARYPNNYPIKNKDGTNAYENVALEYLDVRTSVMRQVFIAFYAIWQDNIFEFAKMTMTQSAKKILDYLYTWIIMYIAEVDQPEALRSFKLIRWYLERGIMQCSDYIITYEPDDLTSGKLASDDDLAIPNDIVKVPDVLKDRYGNVNTTMYIDYKNHVIRNTPSKLNQDTYITFLIENKKNTNISFNISSLDGKVQIILNDTVIEEKTLSGLANLVYNIPYNEENGYNIFRILKKAEYNTDDQFFIGNIRIPDMGKTGNLNIDFDPKLQGNKVLNYASQKVLTYINLYENTEHFVDELSRNNAHLSNTYERMLEYWELHHQDKDKGKRLTIKRT